LEYEEDVMTRQRPTAVLIVAILNLVFGGLGVLAMLCGGLGLLLLIALAANAPPPPGGGPNPLKELGDVFAKIPGYIPYMIVSSVLNSVMAIALIIAGIGLLKMRPWARWTSVGYAVYAIASTIVGLIYTLAVVNPAMAEWQRDFARRQGAGVQPSTFGSNTAVTIFSSVLGMAYAVALLIVLFLPHVSAAFAGRSSGPASDMPDRYPEDDYDDRRDQGDEQFRRG
jgi:hypothetical protein